MNAVEERTVPISAVRLASGSPAEFTFADTDEGEDGFPFKMIANSGQIMSSYYWGQLVVDMDGIVIGRQDKPVLRDHFSEKIAGYTTSIIPSAKFGLDVEGVLLMETEAGEETIKLARKKFPWQASIYVTPTVIERIEEGETAEVNGFTVTGKATIFRKAILHEVSVCAMGVDENTSVNAMSDTGENIKLSLTVLEKEKPMEPDYTKLSIEGLKENRSDLVAVILSDDEKENQAKLSEAIKDGETALSADRKRTDDILEKAEEFGGMFSIARTCIANGDTVDQSDLKFKDQKIKDLETGAPESPGANDDPEKQVNFSHLEGEEKYKAEFEADPKLQKEFSSGIKQYTAFRKNQDAGNIRMKK